MDWSSVAAAGASAIGGLLSNVSTGLFNANQARINRDFQREMYQRQYDDSIAFWKMQNQYNDPSAQLDRLRNAGISPMVAMGSGPLQNVTTQPQQPSQPSGAQTSAAFTNPLDLASYALLDAQRQKILAEKDKIVNETTFQDLQNKWYKDSYNVRLWIQYGEYDKINAYIRDVDDQILNRNFINYEQAASMAQARIYEIKRFNLDEYTIGEQLAQRWKEVASGQIAANAALKNACANLMDAVTRKKLSFWQIGSMAQDILYKAEANPKMLKNLDFQNELNKLETGIKGHQEYQEGYKSRNYIEFGTENVPWMLYPFFLLQRNHDNHK